MTIELNVYLKKKPDFEGFLIEDVGLELVETDSIYEFRKYKWSPTSRREAGDNVYVVEYFESSLYSCLAYWSDQDIDTVAQEKSRQGIILPQDFVRKVKKDDGELIADKEMYQILQNHPELENMLEKDQPLWGILKFTQGEPIYWVNLEGKIYTPQDILTSMSNLTQFLAARYDGIVWDEHTGQFGKPDAKILHQMGSAAFSGFISLIDRLGFEWRPAYRD